MKGQELVVWEENTGIMEVQQTFVNDDEIHCDYPYVWLRFWKGKSCGS